MSEKQKVHFLHIGKTGGTALKSVLREFMEGPGYSLVLHGHDSTLWDVPKGEQVIFFLRDPVSRFVSGFYSRQRKGQPRYNAEWNTLEEELFTHFHTANELANTLADRRARHHALALHAMRGVLHFLPASRWLGGVGSLVDRADDLLFVGFQESLEADFDRLKASLELPREITLPVDDAAAHRNPAEVDRHVDEAGLAALRHWYADDYAIFNYCRMLTGR